MSNPNWKGPQKKYSLHKQIQAYAEDEGGTMTLEQYRRQEGKEIELREPRRRQSGG